MKIRFRAVALCLILTLLMGLLPSGSIMAEMAEEADVEEEEEEQEEIPESTDKKGSISIAESSEYLSETKRIRYTVTVTAPEENTEAVTNITLTDTFDSTSRSYLLPASDSLYQNVSVDLDGDDISENFSTDTEGNGVLTIDEMQPGQVVTLYFEVALSDAYFDNTDEDISIRHAISAGYNAGEEVDEGDTVLLPNEDEEKVSLTLSKAVDGTYAASDARFLFHVYISSPKGAAILGSFVRENGGLRLEGDPGLSFTAANGIPSGLEQDGVEDVSWSTADIWLSAGESLTLQGLPSGFRYYITEEPTDGYVVSQVTVNDTVLKDTVGSKTVNRTTTGLQENVTADQTVIFTNTSTIKDLILSTTVDGADGYSATQPFAFRISLYNADGESLTDSYSYQVVRSDGTTEDGETVPGVDTDIELVQGDTLTIRALPADFRYQITETAVEKYVPLITVNGTRTGADGTVSASADPSSTSNVTVNYLNVYGYTLTIRESAEGGHTWSNFIFQIFLRKANGGKLTGTFQVISQGNGVDGAPSITSLTFSNAYASLIGPNEEAYCGYSSVTLKNGQSITICGLPEDYQYYVMEQRSSNGAGYYSSALFYLDRVDGPEAMDADLVYSAAWQKKIEDDVDLTFHNVFGPNTLRFGMWMDNGDEVDLAAELTYRIYLFHYDADTETYTPITGEKTVTTSHINGVNPLVIPNGTLTFEESDDTLLNFPGTGTAGVATVTLKHGQYITIEGIDNDYGYFIEQVMDPHYFVTRFIHAVAGETVSNLEDTAVGDWYAGTCYNTDVSSRAMVEFLNNNLDVTVTKKVEGIETDKAFTFTIYLGRLESMYAGSLSPIVGDFDIVVTDSNTGEATTQTVHFSQASTYWSSYSLTLKDGQSVTVKRLPMAAYVRVTEGSMKHFTTTISKNGGTATSANSITASGLTSNTSFLFTNTYVPPTTKDLTITKTVTGNWADTTKAFPFTITLTDADGVLLEGTYQTSNGEQTLVDGKLTVHLKNGESFTIYDVPIGARYTVQESEAGKYSTTVTVDGTKITSSVPTSVDGEIKSDEDVITVAYTNDYSVIVPTGINLDVLPYLVFVIFGLGLGMMLLGTYRKSHRK